MNTPEELSRRRKVKADARAKADNLFEEVTRDWEERVARAIKESIARAPEPVSVAEAIEMLKRFDRAQS
ncbi:hypothetical protein [Rhodopseudomonas palustris]|uniref:hypothetical protein n=1 Tax=Rhodopseudomonas palustris TaxID=1076 RepID=UPI0010591CEC|nr:hypothetical protein [Rhodopseudomonas palustris]QLH71675.1 hypothetical protein HZF03_13105 [Rhodopseudomonas palustris]